MATRRYELKRRAELQGETRQRIIEAAIELHQTIGPAATTFTDIAERADVGRVTVYRHFADGDELAGACSALYFQRHPPPDPLRWKRIADPDERLLTALRNAFDYHRATEAMISRVLADGREHPVMQPYHDHWHHAGRIVAAGRGARGRRLRLLRAGIAVALSFDVWRALVRDQGLTQDQAVEVAARLADDATLTSHARRRSQRAVSQPSQPAKRVLWRSATAR